MTPMTHAHAPATAPHPSCGGRLVTADGKTLPFLGADLKVDARGGLARVVLRQKFVNDGDEPLRLTYQVPLPADAAVSGYTFVVGEKRIVGEIDRREAARERFEKALIEGRSAALLEQDRSSVFTQEIGNVPAHTEVTCEIELDQKLRWLAEGRWEWRFPTVIMPRYMGEAGRVPDRAKISVDVSASALPPRATLALSVRDAITGGAPDSPSHALRVTNGSARTEITLADDEGSRLDRDVVVRWPVAAAAPGTTIDVARPPEDREISDAAYGLLTVVPPVAEHLGETVPRDLIMLIDTSGSMTGPPLEQAKAVARAVIASMDPHDQLEMIEFSNEPNRWRKRPQLMGDSAKAAADTWIRRLQPGGCTEMTSAIYEALGPMREVAQRQVLLMTDGGIGFEGEIVAAVLRRLPPGSRVHAIGVGEAVNRSLTASVARVGRGCEIIIGLDEDPAESAERLVARTAAPLVVGLEVSGSAVTDVSDFACRDLLGAGPALIPIRLSPDGGEIVVQGTTAGDPWREVIAVSACAPGDGSTAITTLYGREVVEDLEVAAVTGENMDEEIEDIGLDFQIATRRTSWVAIAEEPSVDPTEPTRRERIPQELPHGTSVEGFGLRGDMRDVSAFGTVCYDCADGLMDHAVQAIETEYSSMHIAPRHLVHGAVRSKDRSKFPLRGRVTLADDDHIVVEFELDGLITWERPSEVILEMSDGSEHTVRVNEKLTTRAGRSKVTRLIRLVLSSIAVPGDEIRAVRFRLWRIDFSIMLESS